ncbi:MAG TPA: monofunctional biosynthetic peptidoglycan transglycosylase [Daejeonella sp.]|nr:monofunctional biosynthetic peptidoglycan transglycosylase [Daejeonella sp.]
MARKKAKNQSRKKNKWIQLAARVLLGFFAITILWVLVLRFVNPPVTFLMIQRGFERKADGKDWKIDKNWRNLDELSSNLKRAALAGEDASFNDHWGFDFKAMETAYQKNQDGKKVRGGSTISQQTAKNVFLWPGRSYVRKIFEAYFTALIELLWGKERILEVYLNVIETGDGIYGVDAACQFYYHKSAEKLSKSQAALLIAVLPNPLRWTPAKPTPYIYYKQKLILRNMQRMGEMPY